MLPRRAKAYSTKRRALLLLGALGLADRDRPAALGLLAEAAFPRFRPSRHGARPHIRTRPGEQRPVIGPLLESLVLSEVPKLMTASDLGLPAVLHERILSALFEILACRRYGKFTIVAASTYGKAAIMERSGVRVAIADDHIDVTQAVRAELRAIFGQVIEETGLSQTRAARVCSTDQPTLSKVLSGRSDSVSTDQLLRWLTQLGCRIEIKVLAPRAQTSGGIKAAFHE